MKSPRKSARKWAEADSPGVPPADTPLDPEGIDRMRRASYRSYEEFLRSRLHALEAARPEEWRRDYTSIRRYLGSIKPMRERLKRMLGFWIEPSERNPVRRKRAEVLMRGPDFLARRFRFEIFPGLESYAVELIPRSAGPHPGLLLQHGYGVTPEIACDLARTADGRDCGYHALGLRAVRRGFHVVAVHHPSGYGSPGSLCGSVPGFEDFGQNYGKNRLHRMAVMAGGTLFGLDMMASSRGIDLLLAAPDVDPERIGMYGKSQGGQSALYLPALDERVKSSVASAYFNSRLAKLIGPSRTRCYVETHEEDKFFTEVIPCFSDADLVSLIAPRAFAAEAGETDSAVDFRMAEREFARASGHYRNLRVPRQIEFIAHRQGHVCATRRALDFLLETLSNHPITPAK